jgi:hypothetical protein
MTHYPNTTVNKVNMSVMSGSGIDLTRIPASFNPDQKTLKVIFNTKAKLDQQDNAPLLDKNNSAMDGVDLTYTFGGHVHTARCSLNGLVALSHDDRIQSITLSGPMPAA